MNGNRKSQVDIALTIGSIVIPVVVLLGALVFAWAMISPITNAGRTAGLVTYDLSRMTDIAYSVPEHIKINYLPPDLCSFASSSGRASANHIVCFKGFMNLSNFTLGANFVPAEYPAIDQSGNIVRSKGYPLTSLAISGQAYFNPDALEKIELSRAVDIQYTAIANSRDIRMNALGLVNMYQQQDVFYEPMLPINQAVVVEKTRNALFDTLISDSAVIRKTDKGGSIANPSSPYWVWEGVLDSEKIINATKYDPLENLVRLSREACVTKKSSHTLIYMPPGFYFKYLSSDNQLCLYKSRIFPDMMNYLESDYVINKQYYDYSGPGGAWYIDLDLQVYKDALRNKSYGESKIYCFDFDSMPSGCTYSISTIPSIVQFPAEVEGNWHVLDVCVSGASVSYSVHAYGGKSAC